MAPCVPAFQGASPPLAPRHILRRTLTPGSFPAALARLGQSARLNAHAHATPVATTALGHLYLRPRCDACAAAKARRHTLLRTSRPPLSVWRYTKRQIKLHWGVHTNLSSMRILLRHMPPAQNYSHRTPSIVRKRTTNQPTEQVQLTLLPKAARDWRTSHSAGQITRRRLGRG